MGGDGGAGGKADLVDAQYDGNISTEGDDSFGMVLQSVGGGGGNGGFTVSGAVVGSGGGSAGVAVGVGGAGGGGGAGGKVLRDHRRRHHHGRRSLDGPGGAVDRRPRRQRRIQYFRRDHWLRWSARAPWPSVSVARARGGGAAETVDVTLNGDAITRRR